MKLFTKAAAWNVAALMICVAVLYWVWPELLHRWVYEQGLLRWPFLLIMGPICWMIYKSTASEKKWTSRLLNVLTGISLLGGLIGGAVYAVVGYATYVSYTTFTTRVEHVITDPQKFRFTPQRVAYRNMSDSVNDAAEHIEADWTAPIITPRGYAYAAPVTPEGIAPIFTDKVHGVMIYEDQPGSISDEERRRRIAQTFVVAPELQWFDSLERKLVLNDFFTVYDPPHLLSLDPSKPEEFVFAAPKTKYAWLLFPYWAGVTIVHGDGRLEDFTPEEVREHPLLKSQWVYPRSLATHYIKLQNFGTSMGLLSPYFQVSGKLEIYEMDDIEPDSDSSASDMETSQQPFLTSGHDGFPYLVAMTKAEGGGSGVYRAYYINAATGEGSYLEYPKGSVHYGPTASLTRVKKVAGYNWRREAQGSVSGNIIVAEPVYVVRAKDPEILYWKGSILATNFAAISATVVAPAADPENFRIFRNRESFEAWLRGDDSVGSGKDELIAALEKLGADYGSLDERIEAITAIVEQMQ